MKDGQKTVLTESLGADLADMRSGDLRKALRRGDKLVERVIDPSGRVADILVLAAIGVIGLGLYLLLLRMLPKRGARLEQAFEPTDPDLAVEP